MLTPSHGGHLAALAAQSGRRVDELLDFSVNVRPEGPPEFLQTALWRAMRGISAYPSPHAEEARHAIAAHLSLSPDNVLPGNGSNALIHALAKALPALGYTAGATILEPAFSEYAKACTAADVPVRSILSAPPHFAPALDALKNELTAGSVVFAANPGNPSGHFTPPRDWLNLFAARPDVFFVLDEAFIDYVDEVFIDYVDEAFVACANEASPPPSVIPALKNQWPDNVAVLRSLTKFYAIPGVRVGFLVAPARVTAALAAPEWNLNAFAVAAACAVMPTTAAERDVVQQDAEHTRRANADARADLSRRLAALPGVRVCPSAANYVLFQVDGPRDLALQLAQQTGIVLRDCANYPGLGASGTDSASGTDNATGTFWFRAAVRTEACHARLEQGLARLLQPGTTPIGRRPAPVPALMLQGTTSDAGKSVLAAAFCRIFRQDGLRVAPFKSQNMSLYAGKVCTSDGQQLEMARAQVMQAQAAGLPPDVRMNPIMLKPCSDTGSHVVVLGKDTGPMAARDYFAARPRLWPVITRAYDELAAASDIMVLEGAGSPGEVNLKHGDVVNMAMARHAKARVLLVGDIDRGGLYAALLGTFQTFSPEERALLLGFLVNRFRGDPTLLGDAHGWLAARTDAPVLGVIPYVKALGLPEEDSLSGVGNTGELLTEEAVDAALDRLAAVVRNAVDMDRVYAALGI